MNELNALPYLDAVVRETLRIHSPVPNTIRVAVKDNIIPLSKPFVDKKGVIHNAIQYVNFFVWEDVHDYHVDAQHFEGRPCFRSYSRYQPLTGTLG